jgi:hypothetical protein
LERLGLEQGDREIAEQGERDGARDPIQGDHEGLLNALAEPNERERGSEQGEGQQEVDGVHDVILSSM